ncbi:MAG: NAD(P)/FAD-dependent oxidoreductase [Anaerolineae bacterium]|nr:NAD(P)/FAD-dependent oxidoreductase [Anaerolineae bacterium]
MNVGIIGAGITGLTAAYDLTRQGHQVTVYEARPYAGGLAAGFSDPHWDWSLERFYHHWFASDQDAIGLIEELGAREQLFFPRPTTSIYHEGRIHPFDSAIRVLQFTPISLVDRLRVGLVTLYLRLLRNWHPLEKLTAAEWTRRAVGDRAYEVLWKPLLISKFGQDHYQNVNMAWFWARLHKRTPRLGYFVGGFQALVDLLVQRVEAQGGAVRLDAPVRGIHRAAAGLRLELRGGDREHCAVIATCSPQALRERTPELPADYAARLDALKSMGAVVLVLALKQRLTQGHYWINMPKGGDIPFMGLVEHTNYIPPDHYGGDHIVYCGDYLAPGHPYFDYDKEQLLAEYLPGIRKVNPGFRTDWIRASWMFAEQYAQPVPVLHHSQNIPSHETPLPGLWLANMSQVYPWDRGTNYAVELGRQVAQMVVADAQGT